MDTFARHAAASCEVHVLQSDDDVRAKLLMHTFNGLFEMHTQIKNVNKSQIEEENKNKGSDAEFNWNHVRVLMSSGAAVMSWPLNSVTNLLFLCKLQTINHVVRSGSGGGGGAFLQGFSNSSLSGYVRRAPTGSHFGPGRSQEVRMRSPFSHNRSKGTSSTSSFRACVRGTARYILPRFTSRAPNKRFNVRPKFTFSHFPVES